MIKTIIIDDEQHCIDSLLRLISNYKDTFNVIGTYNTVKDGVEATKKLNPELVFLDVKIHNETGFDYLNNVESINFDLIFTTAYEKYAIKAFKFSALDYLLKPIDKEDFHDAVLKLKNKLHSIDLNKQIEMLFHNLKAKKTQERINISTINGFDFLEVSDIIYFKADVNYTDIFTKNKNKITTSKTLKSFEELFSYSNFFRVHDSYLINMNHVIKYTKGKGGYVTMSNNTSINVSTRRKSEFIKLIKN